MTEKHMYDVLKTLHDLKQMQNITELSPERIELCDNCWYRLHIEINIHDNIQLFKHPRFVLYVWSTQCGNNWYVTSQKGFDDLDDLKEQLIEEMNI